LTKQFAELELFQFFYKQLNNNRRLNDMQIVLDIDDTAVSDALQLAVKEDITFIQLLENLIRKAVDLTTPIETVELSEKKIKATLEQMLKVAVGSDIDKLFQVSELYFTATGQSWKELSPNTRKAIGRQFRKRANVHYKSADEGDIVVNFEGRTLQNAAMYRVIQRDLLT